MTAPGSAVPREAVAIGSELELEITGVAHGGSCVARHDGQVIFVRHTLPGERVRARVTGRGGGGSFLRADAVAVLTEAPGRVPSRCPYSGPGRCGGCDWQHASLPTQRGLKAAVVAEQLSRLAGITRDVVVEKVPVVEEVPGGGLGEPDDGLGWRTRLRLLADGGRVGFRAHGSHRLVPVRDCPIAHPDLGVSELAGRRWLPHSELEVAADSRGRRFLAQNGIAQQGSPSSLVQEAAGRSWRVHGSGFWQVHPGAADTLAAAVRSALRPRPGESALDLYAGVGLFAGTLAGDLGPTGRVVAVESDARAADDARRNLRDLPRVSVRTGRVDAVLAEVAPAATGDGSDASAGSAGSAGSRASAPAVPPQVDLVVLDPPRTGARAAVVAAIVARAPRAIAYVACDPAALARDVATFATLGYALTGLRAFDMFPMTHHVECVALLEPADRGSAAVTGTTTAGTITGSGKVS